MDEMRSQKLLPSHIFPTTCFALREYVRVKLEHAIQLCFVAVLISGCWHLELVVGGNPLPWSTGSV